MVLQIEDEKGMVGTDTGADPGRKRCTIGSSVPGASAGTCSSGTSPRSSTEDETAEPSSEDLISPCPIVRADTLITLGTQLAGRYYSE